MSVLLFILVLLALVVGHEFGHFIAAKVAKMKVLEFGIGFPPRIWGKKVGETEYTLNWLPFGGFVKIFGEDEKDAGPEAMHRHGKAAQAAVIGAGPVANVVLGFLLFTLSFMVGVPAVQDDEPRPLKDPVVMVGQVLPGSPAAEAGIMAGDRILSSATPEEFAATVTSADGPVTVLIYQNGAEREVTLTPVAGLIEEAPERQAVGIASALIGIKQLSFFDAVAAGATATVNGLVIIVTSLAGLIASALSLSADLSGVAGPVGIATMTGSAAAFGLGSLLSFAAILSLNLAIVNLLPFPALDGGRLFFIAIEAVTRRRIPPTVANALNSVGFALLILLMVAVTIGDVGRLIE